MTPEELKELEELEREEASGALDLTPEEEMELAQLESEMAQEEEIQTSAGEAAARGAMDSLMFGFADEAEAAISTLGDMGNIESFGDLSETYNTNLSSAREEFAKNAENHEGAFIGGQVGGGIASALMGGALLKGAGVVTSGVKSVLTAGAIEGGLYGLGSSEEKMSLQGAIDTAKGAGLGLAGSGVGLGVQKVGGKLINTVKDKTDLFNKALKGLGFDKSASRKALYHKLNKNGIEPIEFFEEIAQEQSVKVIDGEYVLSGKPIINDIMEEPSAILGKLHEKVDYYNGVRNELLSQSNKSYNRREIADMVKARVVGKGINPGDAGQLNKIIDNTVMYETAFDPKSGEVVTALREDPLTALGVTTLRQRLDSNINFDSVANAMQIKRAIRDGMNEVSDDLAKQAVGKDGVKQIVHLRNKMSKLLTLTDSMEKSIADQKFGPSAISKDLFGKMIAIDNLTSPIGTKQALTTALLGLRNLDESMVYNRYKSMDAIKGTAMTKRLGLALEKLPPNVVNRVALAAKGSSQEDFQRAAAYAEAEATFVSRKMPRTVDAFIAGKTPILAILREKMPEMADAAQAAFENGDREQLAQLAGTLSSIAPQYFEEGQGIEGRVFSPEEKAQWEDTIRSNSALPTSQRIQLIERLRGSGQYPTQEEMNNIQPNQGYQPREDRFKKGY